MFRFAAQRKVYWPVTLQARGQDGELIEARALIGYHILTRDELQARDAALLQTVQASVDADVLARARARDDADLALLRERIFDWKDIVDDTTGEPLTFSAETRDAMLADALLYRALLTGLIRASVGAREKNSSPGLAGTPARAQG